MLLQKSDTNSIHNALTKLTSLIKYLWNYIQIFFFAFIDMSKVVFKVVMMSTHVMAPITSLEYHLVIFSPLPSFFCLMIGTNTWCTRWRIHMLFASTIIIHALLLSTLIINLGCFIICIERIMFMYVWVCLTNDIAIQITYFESNHDN